LWVEPKGNFLKGLRPKSVSKGPENFRRCFFNIPR